MLYALGGGLVGGGGPENERKRKKESVIDFCSIFIEVQTLQTFWNGSVLVNVKSGPLIDDCHFCLQDTPGFEFFSRGNAGSRELETQSITK